MDIFPQCLGRAKKAQHCSNVPISADDMQKTTLTVRASWLGSYLEGWARSTCPRGDFPSAWAKKPAHPTAASKCSMHKLNT